SGYLSMRSASEREPTTCSHSLQETLRTRSPEFEDWGNGSHMTQDVNIGNAPLMPARKRFFPFNAEQTINILSEFRPLLTMFVVNAFFGINIGTWSLIVTTVMAIAVMLYMFHRPPVFPLIASSVTVVFAALTIITQDPMWVQIKVTIFNALFGVFLISGLW